LKQIAQSHASGLFGDDRRSMKVGGSEARRAL
jgi:hypothetical protein